MVRALDMRLNGRGFDSRPFRIQIATLGKLFAQNLRGPRVICSRRRKAAADGGRCRSISTARARAQQQTSRTLLLLSIDGTDRRTDGQAEHRTLDRFKTLTAYYADRVIIK